MVKFFKSLLILVGLFFASAPFLAAAIGPIGGSAVAPSPQPVEQQADAIAEFSAALNAAPNVFMFVADVSPGLLENSVDIEVTTTFQQQPKASREQLAQTLWRAWTRSTGVEDVDKARIRLVDAQGRQVGGSRVIAGSVLYVDD